MKTYKIAYRLHFVDGSTGDRESDFHATSVDYARDDFWMGITENHSGELLAKVEVLSITEVK